MQVYVTFTPSTASNVSLFSVYIVRRLLGFSKQNRSAVAVSSNSKIVVPNFVLSAVKWLIEAWKAKLNE